MSHGRNASRFASDGAFAYPPRRFRAILGAATGAAVAALIPANKRVILSRRWYHAQKCAICFLRSLTILPKGAVS